MFGYVTARWKELTQEQQQRYTAAYCGICRQLRLRFGQSCRMVLSYDMAFLALLLMSLYEPEETGGRDSCIAHPVTKRPWVDNVYVRYAADMNLALAYYNCLDDWQDDKNRGAKWMAGHLEKHLEQVRQHYPRQCGTIASCIAQLSKLEAEKCPNPDEPARVFGLLMGELLAVQEDLWADTLRQMGFHLGRFIYLLDAALDYDKDRRKGKYNPFLSMGAGKNWQQWEEYLVLAMGRCTDSFERLPLVQDKAILDNILYSGVWMNYRRKRKEEDQADDR